MNRRKVPLRGITYGDGSFVPLVEQEVVPQAKGTADAMHKSTEKAGWIGAAVGGIVGVMTAVGCYVVDCPPDMRKLALGVLISGGLLGSIGTICGAAIFALIAIIVRTPQSDENKSTNNGQPQSPPSADQPAADD